MWIQKNSAGVWFGLGSGTHQGRRNHKDDSGGGVHPISLQCVGPGQVPDLGHVLEGEVLEGEEGAGGNIVDHDHGAMGLTGIAGVPEIMEVEPPGPDFLDEVHDVAGPAGPDFIDLDVP